MSQKKFENCLTIKNFMSKNFFKILGIYMGKGDNPKSFTLNSCKVVDFIQKF